MSEDERDDEELPPGSESTPTPGVLAATDAPVPIEVREIEDDRLPEGMRCLGTFLDGHLVARCAVPPEALTYLATSGFFDAPRQLVLAAREESPGLRCELYALVPLPPESEDEDDEEAPPWAASVPSSRYEAAVAGDGGEQEGEPALAAILLGQIIRFEKDRRHPESLPLETADVLGRIVSGRVVEVVDKVLEDLLGP